jgi:hypothetical protein
VRHAPASAAAYPKTLPILIARPGASQFCFFLCGCD